MLGKRTSRTTWTSPLASTCLHRVTRRTLPPALNSPEFYDFTQVAHEITHRFELTERVRIRRPVDEGFTSATMVQVVRGHAHLPVLKGPIAGQLHHVVLPCLMGNDRSLLRFKSLLQRTDFVIQVEDIVRLRRDVFIHVESSHFQLAVNSTRLYFEIIIGGLNATLAHDGGGSSSDDNGVSNRGDERARWEG